MSFFTKKIGFFRRGNSSQSREGNRRRGVGFGRGGKNVVASEKNGHRENTAPRKVAVKIVFRSFFLSGLLLVALVSFGAGPLVWLLLSLWVVFLYLYILVLRGYSVSFIAFFIALGVVLTLIFSSVFD